MKLVYGIGFTCLLYAAGCTAKGSANTAPKEIELPVLQLAYKDTTLQKSYVATINAYQNVELRAKVSGFLEKILVDEGQMVKKGQPLFQLNDAEFKVQLSEAAAFLSSARAAVKEAEVELARVEGLVEKKVVSPSELELAKARLAAAEARVQEALAREENARIRLGYTLICAPFDGIIDRIHHKLGSLITEGTLLTTVSDIHQMHVYFNVSENEYLNYVKNDKGPGKPGQTVNLMLADGTVYPYTGKIETVEGEFEPGTGNIAFRASFPNPSRLLKHGASGKIILTSKVSNAMLIPQKAVFEIQDRNYVFALDKDNTVRMKSFVPDTHVEDFILVKSGLDDKDKIIYEGVQSIRDGSKVIPNFISLDSLLALQADSSGEQ
jgi:membrane fusion protein (multidrug efflux system)